MKFILTLCVSIAVIALTDAQICGYKAYRKFVAPKKMGQFVNLEIECFEELGIKESDLQLRARITDPIKLLGLSCFDKCIYDKYGVWTAEDNVNVTACDTALEPKTFDFAALCVDQNSHYTDKCAKAYNTNQCFVNKICDMY